MDEDAKRKDAATDASDNRDKHADEPSSSIGFVDGLRVIFGLILLNVLLSYIVTGDSITWGYRAWWLRPQAIAAKWRQPLVLTDTALQQYNGANASLPIYLALNGTIYDVTAGRATYAPGGPYHFFAGRDAARAFITGCFHDDSVPDYRGAEWTFIPRDVRNFSTTPDEELSPERREYRYEMVDRAWGDVEATVEHWAKVFRGETGKEYFEVGRVRRARRWMDGQPLRELCAAAERKRPKGKFEEGRTYVRTKRAEQARRDELRWARLGKAKSMAHDEI